MPGDKVTDGIGIVVLALESAGGRGRGEVAGGGRGEVAAGGRGEVAGRMFTDEEPPMELRRFGDGAATEEAMELPKADTTPKSDAIAFSEMAGRASV